MEPEYEIFEKFPDGSVLWVTFVPGLVNARLKVAELARNSKNEIYAIHAPTKEIVARADASAIS